MFKPYFAIGSAMFAACMLASANGVAAPVPSPTTTPTTNTSPVAALPPEVLPFTVTPQDQQVIRAWANKQPYELVAPLMYYLDAKEAEAQAAAAKRK